MILHKSGNPDISHQGIEYLYDRNKKPREINQRGSVGKIMPELLLWFLFGILNFLSFFLGYPHMYMSFFHC